MVWKRREKIGEQGIRAEVGEPEVGMIKIWNKFLTRICSEGNMLRNGLGIWKRADETRGWMIGKEAALHSREGTFTRHIIMDKRRRRFTFEPKGTEGRVIPEYAVPTDKTEEWTIRRVEMMRKSKLDQRGVIKIREDALKI